jgi:exodeoxyribonuclease V beta subunit
MEFLYPIPERTHPLLGGAGSDGPAAGDGRAPFRIERGLVKGYIDFVFEHEGRVYVCDWKGDWLPAWDPARVAAHCDRNYAIQAHLYTLAALRLLGITGPADHERRFGGVLYCFLRGMRPDDPAAGVFFRRPAWDEVIAWQDEMLGQHFWGLA